MEIIDLRSDAVTRPSPGMRAAMAAAEVGDDQFGEDPTVNRPQERVAALLGKEAALWLPTGTMANQVALRVFTRPGDDVIVSRHSHAMWHETGAAVANAGIQFTEVGSGGTFTADEFPAARSVVARARERGVQVFAFGPRTIRAVTHLDVSSAACARAATLPLAAIDAPA